MTPTFAFFTFLNAFWLMAFIAIPFSTEYEKLGTIRPASEGYAAAPKTIHWKKAVTIATILATLITLALAVVIEMTR
jgi:predicted secreted protein